MTSSRFNQLDELKFDNRFIELLPADPVAENHVRQVRNACFSYVNPTPVANPRLLACSRDMLQTLGLDEGVCHDERFVQVFAGNQMLPGMQGYAMCYGGHQFGHWAGQLGDGRAILLGDVLNQTGQRWSLQLKGAGPTPYSRRADGLAVLRSSLREFVCSEAMHHLGIATTRALSLVMTGESVVRDMFYDGNAQYEPGAVVCRVAPSFTRFGNFQILTAQRDIDSLRRLADYTITTDFPHLGAPSRDVYLEWFREICERTAKMIVDWMRVGFVHGVMNTDNMSILGLTIDYGPYGWLDDYDEDWTPNTTDAQGRRYRYGNQPMIAHWNLLQLAEAIYPLIEDAKPLEEALLYYTEVYQHESAAMRVSKLGFSSVGERSLRLADGATRLLKKVETDMTLFYRGLGELDLSDSADEADVQRIFQQAWYQADQVNPTYLGELIEWIEQYRHYLELDGVADTERRQLMNRVNPKYVFRNYIAQQAIDRVEEGDSSMLHELLELYRNPYDEQPDKEIYAQKRPEWARHRAGCSMLSCSS